MDWQADNAAQLDQLKADLEDAFDRARHGEASESDWSLIAWQLGISEHYKRNNKQVEINYAVV